ncbi:MAG: hypothetical protein FWD12_01155 [Alphaproteobacteria bacterium]|nr:hypothetical protein [Alphaproteobacteria bacterium]
MSFCLPTLLGACGSSRDDRVAATRAPEAWPECRAAALNDPTVRQMMIADAGVPDTSDQVALAFARNQAERKSMEDKGLMRGGVEPIRNRWYPSPF